MFEGFEHLRVPTKEAEIDTVTKGSGPPLLLIHGYPQTKAMWHKIAPGLAERFTVVATDLRGYGASSRPPRPCPLRAPPRARRSEPKSCPRR